MSSAIKILPHYTYEEYCKWEGRWEIIDGIPYAMAPAPLPRHQLISNKIKYEFTHAIKIKGCGGCDVYDFIDIKIAEDTVLEPDALICCKKITKAFLDFAPEVVVEVLSPSTAMKDRNNKFYQYQSFKIPYFIIVDTDKNEIEIYRLSFKGKYIREDFITVFTFHFSDGCTIDVPLSNIWQ